MRKILFIVFMSIFAFGNSLPQDLDDFTASFSLRSAFNGRILSPNKDENNLKLREIDESLIKNDNLERLFKLGYVQFFSTKNDDLCLAILPDGFFGSKSCKKDLESKEFETVFSIIPTNIGAVQIRSLVLNKDECISVFDNPRVSTGQAFGINRCDLDRLFDIDLRNLMLILPPLIEADVLK